MILVKGFATLAATLLGFTTLSYSIHLDVNNQDSIHSAAYTTANGLCHYYKNNASNTGPVHVGVLPYPLYYWWESVAMWGGLIDFWAYTKDQSFIYTTWQALLAQAGPNNNYIMPQQIFDEGNDDQAFWGCAVLSALETGFLTPPSNMPGWQKLAQNLFNDQVSRWNTTQCNGDLKWQIYPQNPNGVDYKNAISNGGLFQIAARLARYTGNSTYVDWANKVWDWEWRIGLIDNGNCNVYDGTDDMKNCSDINHEQWSYNVAIHLYGAAVMFNYTGQRDWRDRTQCLLSAAQVFFSPYHNATNVVYEAACETIETCNIDQLSFKAYMGRWLAKTTVVAPFTTSQVMPLLYASAQAAAQSCSGGSDGVTCGMKWYVSGWDGTQGARQQLAALEVIQSLLVVNAGPPASLAGQGVPEAQAAGGSSVARSTTSSGESPPSSPSAVVSSSGTRRLRALL